MMANAVSANGCEEGRGRSGSGGGTRPARLPRWTRQEILVLIQGKKVAESRGRGGRGGGARSSAAAIVVGGTTTTPGETKWVTVSSYCRRHGVIRGPVQCRKRWSNLAGDYKKIKEWECRLRQRVNSSPSSSPPSLSFWAMRNDLRREKKLPGFFDREVYDILDGVAETAAAVEEEEEAAGRVVVKEEEEEEAVFDSGRTAAEDGLFSDFEQEAEEEGEEKEEEEEEQRTPLAAPAPAAVTPISEKKFQPFDQGPVEPGTSHEKQSTENTEKGPTSKRRRTSPEESEDAILHSQLIEVLERNSRMLTAQLESHNMNCQLDREQRKDHANSLVGVLGKLADALGRIADKL